MTLTSGDLLSGAQLATLRLLCKRPKTGLTAGELSEQVTMDRAAIYRPLHELEARGLIRLSSRAVRHGERGPLSSVYLPTQSGLALVRRYRLAGLLLPTQNELRVAGVHTPETPVMDVPSGDED